jgi:hypothetical protein
MATPLTAEQQKLKYTLMQHYFVDTQGKRWAMNAEGNLAEIAEGATLPNGVLITPFSPEYETIRQKTGALVMTLSNVMKPLTEDQRNLLQKLMDGHQSFSDTVGDTVDAGAEELAKILGWKNDSVLETLPGGIGDALKGAKTVEEFLGAFKNVLKTPLAAIQGGVNLGLGAIDQIRLTEISEPAATVIATGYASGRQSAADARKDVSYGKGLISSNWADYVSAGFSKLLDWAMFVISPILKILAGIGAAICDWFGFDESAQGCRDWGNATTRQPKPLSQHVNEASIGRDNTLTGQAISTLEKIGGLDAKMVADTLTKGSQKGTLDRMGNRVMVLPATRENPVPSVVNPTTGKPVSVAPTIKEQAAANDKTPTPSVIVRLPQQMGGGLAAVTEQLKDTVVQLKDVAVQHPGAALIAGGAGVMTTKAVVGGVIQGATRAAIANPEVRAEKVAAKIAGLEADVTRWKAGPSKKSWFFWDASPATIATRQATLGAKVTAAEAKIATLTSVHDAHVNTALSRVGDPAAQWNNATVNGQQVHTPGNLANTKVPPLNPWNPLNWPRMAARTASGLVTSYVVEPVVTRFSPPAAPHSVSPPPPLPVVTPPPLPVTTPAATTAAPPPLPAAVVTSPPLPTPVALAPAPQMPPPLPVKPLPLTNTAVLSSRTSSVGVGNVAGGTLRVAAASIALRSLTHAITAVHEGNWGQAVGDFSATGSSGLAAFSKLPTGPLIVLSAGATAGGAAIQKGIEGGNAEEVVTAFGKAGTNALGSGVTLGMANNVANNIVDGVGDVLGTGVGALQGNATAADIQRALPKNIVAIAFAQGNPITAKIFEYVAGDSVPGMAVNMLNTAVHDGDKNAVQNVLQSTGASAIVNADSPLFVQQAAVAAAATAQHVKQFGTSLVQDAINLPGALMSLGGVVIDATKAAFDGKQVVPAAAPQVVPSASLSAEKTNPPKTTATNVETHPGLAAAIAMSTSTQKPGVAGTPIMNPKVQFCAMSDGNKFLPTTTPNYAPSPHNQSHSAV